MSRGSTSDSSTSTSQRHREDFLDRIPGSTEIGYWVHRKSDNAFTGLRRVAMQVSSYPAIGGEIIAAAAARHGPITRFLRVAAPDVRCAERRNVDKSRQETTELRAFPITPQNGNAFSPS